MTQTTLFDRDKLSMLMAIKPPTNEELRQRSLIWQETIGLILMDLWPTEIMALSVPTTFIPFPIELALEWWEQEICNGPAYTSFAEQINQLIDGQNKFFRLNSRSPKDVSTCISNNGNAILRDFASSERMIDDLSKFKYSDLQPVLCIRDLILGLMPEQEFRVFVFDGRIKAVAAYHQHESTQKRDVELRSRIDAFVNEKVVPFLPEKTIVIDVVVQDDNIILLELNPYGLSDPVGAINYVLIEEGIKGIARKVDNNSYL